MDLWGVEPDDLAAIVARVSQDSYGGNVVFRTGPELVAPRTCRVSFGLTVRDSSGPGSRTSASEFSRRRDGGRRRVAAACWHAHRDVMVAIFAIHPSARLKSTFADYRGRDGFERAYPDTYYGNAGSLMYPVSYGELCDCDAIIPAVAPMAPDSYYSQGGHLADGVSHDAERWTPEQADEEMAAWREIIDGAKS